MTVKHENICVMKKHKREGQKESKERLSSTKMDPLQCVLLVYTAVAVNSSNNRHPRDSNPPAASSPVHYLCPPRSDVWFTTAYATPLRPSLLSRRTTLPDAAAKPTTNRHPRSHPPRIRFSWADVFPLPRRVPIRL